jgi:hypothetical protein
MTTVGSAMAAVVREDRHVALDESRARTHAPPVGDGDPAILARRHEAVSCPVTIAEFEATEGRAVQEDGSHQEVAFARFNDLAVDGEGHGRSRAGDQSRE